MTHLSKCFQAIDRLILDESGARPKGCGIVSCVGTETCQWSSPLLLDGKVEQYMNGIIDKMRSELKSVLLNSVKAYPAKPRTEWLFDWPSQVGPYSSIPTLSLQIQLDRCLYRQQSADI